MNCRRVAKQVDVLVHLLDHFQRKLAHQRAIGDQKDRHLLVAMTHLANDLERGHLGKLMLALEVPIQQNRAVRRVGLDQRQAVLGRRSSNHLIPFLADRVDQTLHGPIRYRIGATRLTRNQ